MKILLDMNLPPILGEFLIKLGYEAVHWSSIGDAASATVLRFTSNAARWIADEQGRLNAKGEVKKCRVPLIRYGKCVPRMRGDEPRFSPGYSAMADFCAYGFLNR